MNGNSATQKKKIKIAIDGPSGSGKSTIGRMLASHLGYIYIDSGAMYRALALYLHRNNIPFKDTEKIIELLPDVNIKIENRDGISLIILNGENVSSQIREPIISQGASIVSTIPEVRRFMVKLQREMGKEGGIVMDGRDIGTVVFPDAELKIYLDASIMARANRRFLELTQKGIKTSFEEVKEELEIRDKRDKNREDSPLKRAEDAVYIDTSALSIEEVFEKILKEVKRVLN